MVATVWEGLLWLGVIAAAALVLGIALLRFRRRLRSLEIQSAAGFTLEQLRRLRERGELSPTEYEALRRKSLGQAGISLKPGKTVKPIK